MSTVAEPVLFESNNSLRQYVLNRPRKLNALDSKMIELLRPKIEEWNKSELTGAIVGTGAGRAFCAGGDVAAVVKNASAPETRPQAIGYFKQEFELDYILAALEKPYVAILDGITMGGGVGLASGALFRVATEKTVFAMPETKIGYFPDVGGSYYLSRLDGEIGTYLALTGDVLTGRAVFEHGIATHYIPSRRVPLLLQRLAELDKPSPTQINSTIEELTSEGSDDATRTTLVGAKRIAIDTVFCHNEVEAILEELEQLTSHHDASIKSWASDTLHQLNERSPTSLKVSLAAIRKGKKLQLLEALNLELNVAAQFCGELTPDFRKGVERVLMLKEPGRPEWSPSTVSEVPKDTVAKFFDPSSTYQLDIPENLQVPSASRYFEYALPTEEEIGRAVMGSHANAGDMGATAEEIVALFERLRHGKLGVREKVEEVLQRKCTLIDNADGNFVWLKWIHN
ncbi:hypothetical protein NMY22_g17299 [Coprinellus aureogranulatus]|nr:hypothetical protein NMY22_g17299 [Coprinellus aureogranulatus]